MVSTCGYAKFMFGYMVTMFKYIEHHYVLKLYNVIK